MDVTEAGSGPVTDKASSKTDELGSAINAAIDAASEPTLSKTLSSGKAKEKIETEASSDAAPGTDKAGDESGLEKAPPKQTKKPDDLKAETAAPEAAKSREAPKHWAAEDKAAFDALDDNGKAVLLKLSKNLEGGFTRKSQELSDKVRYAEAVRGLFTDADRAQMAAAQTDEMGIIAHLLQVQRFATENPKEYMKWAMQNLRVKPEDLGIAPQPTKSAPAAQAAPNDDIEALLRDPAVSKLEAELAASNARLQQIEAKWQAEEQAKQRHAQQQQRSQVEQLHSSIRSFREEQDDHGQLKYPHFDAVQRHMGALMDADPDISKMADGPDKLKAAYEMAVWARPDLRQSLLDAETKIRAVDEQKKRDAEKAKRATAVKPSAGVSGSKTKPTSLDDALSQTMSKMGL